MSAGTVATAIDKVTPKTPTALRVAFTQTAGNETDLNFFILDPKDYITKQMLLDYVGVVGSTIRVPFTGVSTVVINWQTDIPPGSTDTYATLYGNYVEAELFFTPIGSTGIPQGIAGQSWTIDGSGDVQIVTFDWGGDPTDGYIKFNG